EVIAGKTILSESPFEPIELLECLQRDRSALVACVEDRDEIAARVHRAAAFEELFAPELRHPPLAQTVLAAQRADDPSLFQLAQPAVLMQRDDRSRGGSRIVLEHPHAQVLPTERARTAQALEAIDELELATIVERGQRRQLPTPFE